MISHTLNIGFEDYTKDLPDGFFDLVIADPNYGIDAGNDFSGDKRKSGKGVAMKTAHAAKEWDKEAVSKAALDEIFRVSKNQIIFGANHFISRMPYDSPCWIVWDKMNGDTNFADCELAWTSFKGAVRKFEFKWNGMLQGDMKNKEIRQHPTQKPVALYKWILTRFAKYGWSIFDPMMGSQSSRIAAHDLGFDYYGCEKDNEYYVDGESRYSKHILLPTIFKPAEMYDFRQTELNL